MIFEGLRLENKSWAFFFLRIENWKLASLGRGLCQIVMVGVTNVCQNVTKGSLA